MADSWIKMRVTLLNDPRVVRMASALNAHNGALPVRKALVVGLLYATWALADTYTESGDLPGYTPEALDDAVGFPGWTDVLASVGWVDVSPDGLTLPGFEQHNGKSAKRRSKNAARMVGVRDSCANGAHGVRTESAQNAHQSESESESKNSTTPPNPPPEGGSADKPRRGGGKVRLSLHDVERLAAAACVPDDALPAVRDWWGYRKDSGKPLVRASWERLLSEAAKDPALFVASVEHSIRQGSQGLFPPSGAAAKPADRLTPRAAQQRRNREAMAEAIRREEAGSAPPGRLGAPLLDVSAPTRPGGHVGPSAQQAAAQGFRLVDGGAA